MTPDDLKNLIANLTPDEVLKLYDRRFEEYAPKIVRPWWSTQHGECTVLNDPNKMRVTDYLRSVEQSNLASVFDQNDVYDLGCCCCIHVVPCSHSTDKKYGLCPCHDTSYKRPLFKCKVFVRDTFVELYPRTTYHESREEAKKYAEKCLFEAGWNMELVK